MEDMMGVFGNIDEANLWIEVPGTVSVWQAEERLRSRGLTLGSQPPSVLRGTVREWLEGPYAGRWVEAGRLAPCVAALKVILDDGSVVRTFPVPRSAAGPSITQVFLGNQGALGEITWAVLRARRMWRRTAEVACQGSPELLARWLEIESRRLQPPVGAEIAGGERAVLSMLFPADTEWERARVQAARASARELGLSFTETPGQLGTERYWESEVPSDAWENLFFAIPAGHRVWLARIARESAVAVCSELTGHYLPVLVSAAPELDALGERIAAQLRPH